jgi:transcriptional regulator with XRE-family HTH domain
MKMAQVIDAERLKRMRKLRGLTQDELAGKARLNKQTVYRLERENRPIRKRNLEGLAQGLVVDPEVLTGEKPIPVDASQPSAPADEIAYQLNVRVDAAIRNAFELVARRYGVSVAKIAQLAPLLFVIVADASLRHRREKLHEFEAALDHISELGSHLPHFTASCFYGMDDHEQSIRAEEASIDSRDLFGLDRFDPDGVHDEEEANPFVAYLKALTAGRDDITVSALGPTSIEYRVCHSVATELAGGDEQVADWLLKGEVPIHRMPRGLKTVAERVEWMGQNKISIRKVTEQPPEGFPGDLQGEHPTAAELAAIAASIEL